MENATIEKLKRQFDELVDDVRKQEEWLENITEELRELADLVEELKVKVDEMCY